MILNNAPFQVMTRCDGVFGTWDDEYDKFTGQLREMSKKKREETLKFSWRANSANDWPTRVRLNLTRV